MSQTLKYARERLGWTVEQLALRAGLTPRSVYRLERSDRSPHFSTVVKLEKVLRLKRGQLRFPPPKPRKPHTRRQQAQPEAPPAEVAAEPLLPADLSPADEVPVVAQDAPDLG